MWNPTSSADVARLVDDGTFSFVVAFSNEDLDPVRVMIPLMAFAQSVFVEMVPVAQSVYSSFGGTPDSLIHSPVVFVVREEGRAVVRQVTFGPPSSTPWGLALPVCLRCESSSGMQSTSEHPSGSGPKETKKVCFMCVRCNLDMVVVKPLSVESVGIGSLKYVFTMPFPPPVLVASVSVGGAGFVRAPSSSGSRV